MKRLLPLVLALAMLFAIVPQAIAADEIVLFKEIATADITTQNYKISGTDFTVEDGAYVYKFAAEANGAQKTYAKGEIAWFNFGINIDSLNVDKDAVTMQAKAFAGTGTELKLANAVVTAEKAFGMKVEAAEDNTKIVFEVIVNNATLMLANEFDAYLVISTAKADIKAAKEGEATEVIAPYGNAMTVANLKLTKVELEGGKLYPAKATGYKAFMDENMNVIANTFGDELALTPMANGTYYVAAENNVTVGNPVETGEFAIDLTKLSNADEHYAYHKFDDLAVLEVVEPGVYTLTGEAKDTVLYIHNAGIKVVLDNAKIGNVQIDAMGYVEINAKGEAEINGLDKVDEPAAIYTVGNFGYVAITGEKLAVTGKSGINLYNAGLYINAMLTVKTTGVGNENGVAASVYGQFAPAITLGIPCEDDNCVVVKTYFDEAMKYQYGEAIAEEALYIFGDKAEATEFKMFEPFYGDANRDGNVNTSDAVVVLKYLAQLSTLDSKAFANADVNRDGLVDTMDVTYILQYCADMIAALPVK